MLSLHALLRRARPSAASALFLCGAALAAIGLSRTQNQNATTQAQPPPTLGSGATADSNQRMVAVTGVDVTGASVLYLVDTVNMRLAVYQANSSGSNQGVRLVGARRIELDMELNGFHDNSEYSYTELKEKFAAQGLFEGEPPAKPRNQ